MKRFDLTLAAKADLKSIARYTGQRWGVQQRNAYLKEMDELFHVLLQNPLMGRACDEIRKGYFKFPHRRHVVYYKQADDGLLLVVRILHGAMDVDASVNFPADQ